MLKQDVCYRHGTPSMTIIDASGMTCLRNVFYRSLFIFKDLFENIWSHSTSTN